MGRGDGGRKAVQEIFDFQEVTKRVCGQHWNTRTPAEREELVSLFRALLEPLRARRRTTT